MADKPIPLGPWPHGVNNRAAETEVPAKALREAVNVDLTDTGWPRRRRGRVNRIAATRAHSLFAADHYLLANVDGALCAYARAPTGALSLDTTVRAGIGPRYVSFAQVNEEVYWTNELELRRITSTLADKPVALPTPTPPTVAAASTGGLIAGEYLVSLTWRDAEGRESGACNPSIIVLTAGQGILLTNLPAAPTGATTLAVWCSPANPAADQVVLYLVRTVPGGTSGLTIGVHNAGPALQTLWHIPLPPGHLVRFWNGRLLIAAGAMLCWSPALRFGLMHQDSALRFGERITLLEPVGEGIASPGVFVADHKRTYFLAGDNPDTWQKRIVYPYPAVPGVSAIVPGDKLDPELSPDPVLVWLASNGVLCMGLADGTVVGLTDKRVALPIEAERGAAVFHEFDGLRQILTSFLNASATDAGVSDSSVATVRRNGVTLD